MNRICNRFAALVVAGTVGLGAAGCNLSGVSQSISSANNVLADLAKNNIPAACGIIAVAEGYFNQLKGNISAKNVKVAEDAMAAVAVICDNPPKNVAEVGVAFTKLLNLWLTIQNATKTN